MGKIGGERFLQRSLNYKYSFEFAQNLLEKYFEIW